MGRYQINAAIVTILLQVNISLKDPCRYTLERTHINVAIVTRFSHKVIFCETYLKTHTGVKSYHCGKAFSQNSHLQSHLKTNRTETI